MFIITAILMICLSLLLRVIVTLPLAVIIMWCWDVCMPALFNLPRATYWQSFALCMIVGLLLHLDVTVSRKEKE